MRRDLIHRTKKC